MKIVDRKPGKNTEVIWVRCKKTARVSTIEKKYGGSVLASESVKTYYAGQRIPKGHGSKIVSLRRRKRVRKKKRKR